MYVCVCAAVTEAQVQECLDRPDVHTVDDVGERCFAGTGCGSCHARLEGLLRTRGDTFAEAS